MSSVLQVSNYECLHYLDLRRKKIAFIKSHYSGTKMHDLVKDVNSGLVESMTRLKSSLIINYYDGRSLIINSDLIDITA